MSTFQLISKTSAVCALACVLAACGSSDSLPTAAAPPVINLVPGTDIPVSATSSASGATEFVKTVVASSADTAEPLAVGDAVLSTTDTEEPDPSV
jgi:hypothetical protein